MSDQHSDPESARWRFEQNRQLAERLHDRQNEIFEKVNLAAIESANITLRTLILINGGAAIAVLAFLGSVISSTSNSNLSNLAVSTAPIVWFAWGVAMATLAMGLAYITNYCIASVSNFRALTYEHPFVEDTTASKRWARWGIGFQLASIVLAVASLVFFLVGMYSVKEAAASQPETPTITETLQ